MSGLARLPDAATLIAALARGLARRLAERRIADPYLIGIQTGGVWVAERLGRELGIATALGTLDISFHRDDFASARLNPTVQPSHLPWDVAGRHLVLVDDVLYTGRTVRAAINEIFDWGRPASVMLAVLVVRDGRELPVQADAVGTEMVLEPGRTIKLHGPEPLRLESIATHPRGEPRAAR